MSDANVDSCPTTLVDVLPLVIQHSSISKQLGSVCSLLCTCQQTAQAVVEHSIGKVHLRAQTPAHMAWFGKYWRLVRSLYSDATFQDAAMLGALEQGLADAAARCKNAVADAQGGAGIPHLQSVQAFAFPPGALVHLQSFTTLTSLRIQGMNQGFCVARPQLEGLTSLRCLAVETDTNSLLHNISSLTNLTSLSVKQLTPDEGMQELRHLPPQLQELTITPYLDGDDPPRINLSHVTGLTRLMASASDDAEDSGWVVGSYAAEFGAGDDRLPPNCRHLSVKDMMSAKPLLKLQHLERLEIHRCNLTDERVQDALQQLSSLSTLTDIQLNIETEDVVVGVDETAADVLLGLPSLRGLQLWYSGWVAADDYLFIDPPVLSKLFKLSALQRLSLQKLRLLSSRLADAICGLRGLQSLRWDGCCVGFGNNIVNNNEFASVVGAIARLPELRDLRLAFLPQWDEAASAALAAATQLTGLMFLSKRNCAETASLAGQVHKLSGLRWLWIDTPGMVRFDMDAAAASLTGLTELCLGVCDPQLLRPKFPGAALGRIWVENIGAADPLSRGSWEVHWWSPAEGDWKAP